MLRKLLAATAIATLVATGAFAQETTPAPVDPAAPTMDSAPATQPEIIRADGHLATNIIGVTVYNGTGDDAENIGSVNDIVFGADGSVESVVIGVGGFLGLGEKNVTVAYDEVNWAEESGTQWMVVNSTKEQLEAQADFDRRAYDPALPVQPDPTATGATE